MSSIVLTRDALILLARYWYQPYFADMLNNLFADIDVEITTFSG